MKFALKFLSIAAAALAVCSVASCGSSDKKATEEGAPAEAPIITASPDTVTVLTDDELLRPGQKVTDLTVIDFNAPWCGPCKKLDEPMRMAAKQYAGKVHFYSANVDALPLTDQAFEINKSVPVVVLLLPEGTTKKYATLEPFISKDELKDASIEQVTETIFKNLIVIIDENL